MIITYISLSVNCVNIFQCHYSILCLSCVSHVCLCSKYRFYKLLKHRVSGYLSNSQLIPSFQTCCFVDTHLIQTVFWSMAKSFETSALYCHSKFPTVYFRQKYQLVCLIKDMKSFINSTLWLKCSSQSGHTETDIKLSLYVQFG